MIERKLWTKVTSARLNRPRPRICHEPGRSPLKSVQRRVNPRRRSKIVYEDSVNTESANFSGGSCATRGPLKAILCYEKAVKSNPVLREGF